MIEVYNETNSDAYIKDIENILKLGLKHMNIKDSYISVVIVDKDKIHEINKTYRDVDKVTDVISFAFEDNGGITPDGLRILGEIYLCMDKAKEQAIEYGHSNKREICYLVTHGLLHLLGYVHEKEEDKNKMRIKEEEILELYDANRWKKKIKRN